MSDTYKFKRQEFRAELFKACCALINSRPIAEYTYEFIIESLDDFLSEHEVKEVDKVKYFDDDEKTWKIGRVIVDG